MSDPSWMEMLKQCGGIDPNDDSKSMRVSIDPHALERKLEIARKLDAFPDLLKALEAVEWSCQCSSRGLDICPECGSHKYDGHDDGCQLNQALKKARGEG